MRFGFTAVFRVENDVDSISTFSVRKSATFSTLEPSKDGTISMGDLMKHFQANDFSTMVSRYDVDAASSENNELYLKVKQVFQNAWDKGKHKQTQKKTLMNRGWNPSQSKSAR